jgi:hypothetical protein
VHRPDLRILTLPVRPSRFTRVTNLDPTSPVLADGDATLVDSYRGLPMRVLEVDRRAALGIDPRTLEAILADLR